MDPLSRLEAFAEEFSTAPTLERMPRRTLLDKGIGGPTSAHVIEEIHTPFNLAYVTATTGSTAFQNLVGVTALEIPDRIQAAKEAFRLSGVSRGGRVLFTYPPLVNVFPKEALEAYDLRWSFLKTSSRDAFLAALCRLKPEVIIGESSFMRAALRDAGKSGVSGLLPQGGIYLAAGTPLDPELWATVREAAGGTTHDLYGCQEFGWLTLDGIPLRRDITLLPAGDGVQFHLIVGGLPTGDCFPVLESGHPCNPAGKILTNARIRSGSELEATLLETTALAAETAQRLCRTVLRIKAKIVRCAPDLVTGAEKTVLSLAPYRGGAEPFRIEGPEKTALLDSLLQAQQAYQGQNKADPAWRKGR